MSEFACTAAAQARVGRAAQEWKSGHAADVLAALERYGAGAPLEECPPLAALLDDPDIARPLVDALVSQLCTALAEAPLAALPSRHQYAGGLAQLRLAESGRAILTLALYEPRVGSPPPSVTFSAGELHELVLVGRASIRMVESAGADAGLVRLVNTARAVEQGDRIVCKGNRNARVIDQLGCGLVMLRLARTAASPAPDREYSLTDGKLLHQASSSAADSRIEIAMAVLGAMSREDAVPVLAAIARNGEGQISWQAMRQCLALDTEEGIAVLREMAKSAGPALAGPAGQLLHRLCLEHPDLRGIAQPPCPG